MQFWINLLVNKLLKVNQLTFIGTKNYNIFVSTAINLTLFFYGLYRKCVCLVRFQCQVTEEPEPTLTWFYNDQPLTSGPRIQLTFDKTTTTLTILNSTVQDSGEYTCKVTNTLGDATTKTLLRVRRTYLKPATGTF